MAIRNFLFHRISPVRDVWSLPIAPQEFERYIREIKKNFEVRAIEEMMGDDDLKKYKGKNIATLSFDDGFKDNIEYAAPILKTYNCNASFYVVTDSVEKNELNWSHILPRIFLKTSKLGLKVSSEVLGDIDVQFSSVRERLVYGKELYQRLKNISFHHTKSIMDQLSAYFDDVDKGLGYMMNWNDLNELKNAGFYIGAHTKTHPFLANITQKETLDEELRYPYLKIRSMCGHFPLAIAYPSGDCNEQVKKVAKEIGYEYGLAVGQKDLNADNLDPMEIPRIDLYADSGWWKNYLRINGYIDKIKKILGR